MRNPPSRSTALRPHVVDAGDDHDHDGDGDHSDGEESNDEIDNDDDYLDKYCKSILCEYP